MDGTRIAIVAVLARSARRRRILLTAGFNPAEAPSVRPIEVEGERE